jgi:hypothetical protein
MTFSHGRKTFISLNASDLSLFTTTSQLEKTADKHDVTTYGLDNHAYNGGLKDGTATMSGIYDNTAAGPRAIVTALIGTVVTLVRRPDGTGTGKAQDSVSVLVVKYNETNPVADMVTWSCDMQMSGPVTTTPQP